MPVARKTISDGWNAADELRRKVPVFADIDPRKVRQRKIVRVPGKHSIDRMKDRRPEFYGPILDFPVKIR